MFTGKKFFCSGETITTDRFGNTVIKPEFRMTKDYAQYLREKNSEKALLELLTLRDKLRYQKKVYNEYDEIDYTNYMTMINPKYVFNGTFTEV